MVGRITVINSLLMILLINHFVYTQTFFENLNSKRQSKKNIEFYVNKATHQQRDNFFGPDKAKHFLVSMILTVFLYKTSEVNLNLNDSESRILAGGFTLTLGISKEIWDKSKPENHFSWKDLATDILGICTGLMIINQP